MPKRFSISMGNFPNRSVISSLTSLSCSSVVNEYNRRYRASRSASPRTYDSGMKASRSASTAASLSVFRFNWASLNSSLNSSCFNSCTASSRIRVYASNPIFSMKPLCSAPRRFPAPRISRSRMARLNPDPSSVNSSTACSRCSVLLGMLAMGGVRRYAYACAFARPTRPRSWYSSAMPNLSARLMKIVLTFGMSNPDSMIFVATSTSHSFCRNAIITFSSACDVICPCAVLMRTSGRSFCSLPATSSIVCTLSWTKYNCPPRCNSRAAASRITSSFHCMISVIIGRRFRGGVAMIERSRAPIREKWRVRGIGVAVKERVSTSLFKRRSFSLAATPNRCSSSMMRSPRFLNVTSFERSRCVPIITSTSPSRIFPTIADCSCFERKRDTTSSRTP